MRIPAILFFCLFLFVCSIGNVSAQNQRMVPTARLLTLPSDVTSLSRPRRVSSITTSVTSLGDANEIERRAFESTNVARVKNGLAPLVWSAALCQVARTHSESMVRRGYFDHESPDGERLRDRVRAVGIAHFRVLGENIAYNQGYDDPGGFAVERWMISPGHRANILSNEFEQAAVGSFVAPDGTVYLTQVFIKR
jgi:uncharacterized protein YkwD